MIPDSEQANYEIFRDALSNGILAQLALDTSKEERRRSKGRKRRGSKINKSKGNLDLEMGGTSPPVVGVGAGVNHKEESVEGNGAEDLAEFIDYLSTEIFPSLPTSLRTLSYASIQDDPSLSTMYSTPLTLSDTESLIAALSPSIPDSLSTYTLITSLDVLPNFLAPILDSFIIAAVTPPALDRTSAAQATECELCHREHIPLSYHHLIPRSQHAKVLKRGWHKEWELNKVAWLCSACHRFVHKIETNEELARNWFTVEMIESREDVQRWVKWIGRVRWKAR